MPTYYVTINRPGIDAATPEEAVGLALSTPLVAGETAYAKEVPVDGFIGYVAGAATVLGGAFPLPDEIYEGPGLARRVKPVGIGEEK